MTSMIDMDLIFESSSEDDCEEKIPPAVGQWLGDFTASLTKSFKASIPRTKNAFEDLAGAIQRSASTIATELANLEMEADREARRWVERINESSEEEVSEDPCLPLPWQVKEEVVYFDDNEGQKQVQEFKCENRFVDDDHLKSEIFALSKKECTFTEPYRSNEDAQNERKVQENEEFDFDLENHMSLIHRLLEIDRNLRDAHAKLSIIPVDERNFWKNYFFHCAVLKQGREIIKIDKINSSIEKSSSLTVSTENHTDSDIVNDKEEQDVHRSLSLGDFVLIGDINED